MGSRRDFIKKTTLGAGGLALGLSAKSYGRVLGANDRIRVAFMGCGRRVGAYYESLEDPYNTELAYICDVKKSQRDKVAEDLKDQLSYTPQMTDDIREVLDDPEVDAIFNATPDHWHAPGALMAMKAGKHVYVEKPCSHNPQESELLIAAQEKFGKVVQMGNQQRSAAHTTEIIDEIHNGRIGDVYKAVAFYSNRRGEVTNRVPQDPPSDLNWELFQGPAPREAYHHNTWDYNWHWYGWKWGTAETGNNATHEVDIARWALQVDYPEQVYVDAAKQHFPDDGWTMYDTMYATFEFPDGKVINWDGKSRNGLNTYGAGRGTIIYGTEGSVFVNRSVYRLYDRDGELVREQSSGGSEQGTALGGGGSMSTQHVVNFLDTIRGTAEQQNSPIDEGAKSVHMCHLANIAYRVNKPLETDPSTGRIYDREAMGLWGREYEPGWEPKL
ncbi:Gfo/Idh/MocA family protein [Fodinibius sediminis]|uniref:Tat (Twin-arginine translocation) pathway signal sequence n=1 Tax=Fodinibius sediminis TaxID=1214077 RepID=A0A521E953_9BACT|nr:Gfo/Idh/MocA family oxidoreductase [Fodinibius sediminis]SMO79981.1 Tat (twin-arginine translocation) pathway signal sequence [Fodinibius sediminis]